MIRASPLAPRERTEEVGFALTLTAVNDRERQSLIPMVKKGDKAQLGGKGAPFQLHLWPGPFVK